MRTDIRFSYDEYRALPETGPHYQLVDGDLIMSPAPTFRHQEILMRLIRFLDEHIEKNKLGKLLCAPLDVIFSDEDVYQPDLIFISSARKSIIVPEGLRGTPELCIEILSPSNKELDQKTKRLLYARFGLPELWLVDPIANTLQVYRLQEDPHHAAQTLSETNTLNSVTFPGLELKLDRIFAK